MAPKRKTGGGEAAPTIQEAAMDSGGKMVKSEVCATFYPKFENEKSDQEIRQKMIEVVGEGRGALEITLKHSGSLFMYSGDGRAFAKNSFGNLYTAVGVYVLGKMLEQAWEEAGKEKQREFNAHLCKNRISISMELVTAVLGDHGQRPLKDYAVVTAVADLGGGRPRFYSTAELVQFCRQWRLPTNQVWLSSTKKAATACFASYDALYEEGIYTTVTDTLNKVADFTVPGTESHALVQGEILEGLVARIVSPQSVEQLRRVAKEYPVPPHEPGAYSAPGLREICAQNKKSEKQQIDALLQAVGPDFCSSFVDWKTKRSKDDMDAMLLSKFLKHPAADGPTQRLQEMIQLIRSKRFRVKLRCQPRGKSDDEFRMTVHVIQDAVFRRYQKEMVHNKQLWPLYRGFFVDVKFSDLAKVKDGPEPMDTDDIGLQDGLADDAQNLMVKLKFLTYKIRTFLIRNGLDILFTRGHPAYKDYYKRQMSIWGTSPQKQRELTEMLDEWAVYITGKYKSAKNRLRDGRYLSEAEPFMKEYAGRSVKNQRLIGQAGTDISTDEYMATLRFDDDEEGDLKEEGSTSAAVDPPLSKVKNKGMLIFFPGIPGCAKSSICKEIINAKGGFGDDLPMKSLMGDMIKGKYWPRVETERTKNPACITFADKNAPNDDVWKTVERICHTTDALGVPVVPESQGSDSNPFSLETLAVFIYRVLQRERHPGKLDKNSPYAGYVLLMFYDLYDGKDRSEFEADLLQRFGCLVKAPVLKQNRPAFPVAIKAVLEQGMDLFFKHRSKHGRADPSKSSYKREWDEWEARLKSVLSANSDYFNKCQVPFDEVVRSVRDQLMGVASGDVQVDVAPKVEKRKVKSYNYAAVTLPVEGIVAFLDKAMKSEQRLMAFLGPKNIDKIRSAHVTLAHVKSHGIPAVAEYGDSQGDQVPVEFSAVVFSGHACALEARIVSDKIASKNPWPHVTLWTAPGVPPKEAGALGHLASDGKATRVPLAPPVTLTGTVEFKF